jgi:hypothetical protein
MIWIAASPWISGILLFGGLLVALESGRWLGRRWIARHPAEGHAPSAIDAAVLALFGLLVAFAFSGAASRFDERRGLIVQEANAIGTAYARLDLLAAPDRSKLQESFRQYVELRIDAHGPSADPAKARRLQQIIWSDAVRATAADAASPSAKMLLLPALNEMIDLTTTRAMVARMHPPSIISAMLVGVALIGALLGGHALAAAPARPWLHMLSFALVVTLVIYVIADLEYPRVGYLRVDDFDSVLRDLRWSMSVSEPVGA